MSSHQHTHTRELKVKDDIYLKFWNWFPLKLHRKRKFDSNKTFIANLRLKLLFLHSLRMGYINIFFSRNLFFYLLMFFFLIYFAQQQKRQCQRDEEEKIMIRSFRLQFWHWSSSQLFWLCLMKTLELLIRFCNIERLLTSSYLLRFSPSQSFTLIPYHQRRIIYYHYSFNFFLFFLRFLIRDFFWVFFPQSLTSLTVDFYEILRSHHNDTAIWLQSD